MGLSYWKPRRCIKKHIKHSTCNKAKWVFLLLSRYEQSTQSLVQSPFGELFQRNHLYHYVPSPYEVNEIFFSTNSATVALLQKNASLFHNFCCWQRGDNVPHPKLFPRYTHAFQTGSFVHLSCITQRVTCILGYPAGICILENALVMNYYKKWMLAYLSAGKIWHQWFFMRFFFPFYHP